MLERAGHSGSVAHARFSPDGRQLVTAAFNPDSRVRVWDLVTGKLEHLLPIEYSECGTFSPDGTRLAVSRRGRQLHILDAQTLEKKLVIDAPVGTFDIAYSPDGRRIAAAGPQGLMVWDAATGERLLTHESSAQGNRRLKFSPDGRWLACRFQAETIVWNAGTLDLHKRIPATGLTMTFSADGEHLALGQNIYAVRLMNLEPSRLALYACDFSLDGRLMLTKDGEIGDAHTGELLHQLPIRASHVWHPVFAPDSRHVVSFNANGTMSVYRLPKIMIGAERDNHVRKVLRWVIEQGGSARVYDPQAGHLELEKVEDFEQLSEGKLKISRIVLQGTAITGADLQMLSGIVCQQLLLRDTHIGDEGLKQLTQMAHLDTLYLTNTGITDNGLRTLKQIAGLTYPAFGENNLTDAGIAHLAGMTQLEGLVLNGNAVSDDAVPLLSTLRNLKGVSLLNTKMSEAGIARLHQALPECTISSNYGTFGPGAE
jgi:hypothetical protein